MRTDNSRMAAMSDPIFNRLFSRRWDEQPMTARDVRNLADLEAERGQPKQAEQLRKAAREMRT